MTTSAPVTSDPMGKPREIDLKTRQRIAANLRQLRWMHRFESVAGMAKEVGMSRGALGRYLSGERTTGLDVLLLFHRRLHVSLDWLVDRDPDDHRWFDPEYWPIQRPA
jgi:transcriptional regulator with XRE-family HTH domain